MQLPLRSTRTWPDGTPSISTRSWSARVGLCVSTRQGAVLEVEEALPLFLAADPGQLIGPSGGVEVAEEVLVVGLDDHGLSPPARDEQVEQDRASALLAHQLELARTSPHQSRGGGQSVRRHDYSQRPQSARRTRSAKVAEGRHGLRQRHERNRPPSACLSRRVELHHHAAAEVVPGTGGVSVIGAGPRNTSHARDRDHTPEPRTRTSATDVVGHGGRFRSRH